MSPFIDILLVDLVVIYIVDLSGFTDSWRNLLSRMTGIKNLRTLPPFDCGKCMTWWAGLVYVLINWGWSLPLISYVGLLSFLSVPIGNTMIFIREWITWIIDKLSPRWKRN